MLRLKGLAFTGSQSGPQGRTLRPATSTGARSTRAPSGLSFLCEDMHNDVLMTCDPEVTGEEAGTTAAQAVAAREAARRRAQPLRAPRGWIRRMAASESSASWPV